jgi:hypothetical protein
VSRKNELLAVAHSPKAARVNGNLATLKTVDAMIGRMIDSPNSHFLPRQAVGLPPQSSMKQLDPESSS